MVVPPRKICKCCAFFLIVSAHWKNCLKWGQEDLFPTNPDLADIGGRPDLDFENVHFCYFVEFQIASFPGSNIIYFPIIWIFRLPQIWIFRLPEIRISRFPKIWISRLPKIWIFWLPKSGFADFQKTPHGGRGARGRGRTGGRADGRRHPAMLLENHEWQFCLILKPFLAGFA